MGATKLARSVAQHRGERIAPRSANAPRSFRPLLSSAPVLRSVPASLVVLAALLVGLAACDAVGPVNEPPPEPPAEPAALSALLADDGNFETLAGLAPGRLAPGGDATLFAPDDEAFALLSPATLAGLTRQPGVLDRTLAHHVVTARVDLDDLADGDLLPTREGTPLRVRIDDQGTVFVGDARVEGRIGSTPDGPVYRVSRVLLDHLTVRERLAASSLLSRSLAYFEAAGIDLTQPGTYFVPLNGSYDAAPGGAAAYTTAGNEALARKTLRALVVPGEALSEAELRERGSVETAGGTTLDVRADGGFTVLGQDESRVLVADLAARGATVHLIGPPPQGHLSLIERVRFLPSAAPFAQMLDQAGLAETLDAPGSYTVFTPSAAAFDSIGTRGRTVLLTEPDLGRLLARFHVSPEIVPSSDLVVGADIPSLAGEDIRVRPNLITGNNAAIAQASLGAFVDLPASNGRLHLVESFLNPALSPYDQLILSGMADFRAAVRIAGYQELYESNETLTVIGPASIDSQFLRPGFECRARELVGDHTARGAFPYTPMAPGFTALSDAENTRFVVRYNSPTPFTLQAHVQSAIDVTVTQIGGSRALYLNAPLPNGGILHAVERRMRWYATGLGGGGHTLNLPPC